MADITLSGFGDHIFAGSISADRIAYNDAVGFYDPKSVTNPNQLLEKQAEMISPYNLNYDPENGLTTNRRMTNADRIRNMSVQEMADFMKDVGMACPDGHFVGDYGCKDCKDCWLDWLKQEVEM